MKRKMVMFSIGACGYGLLELAWRGRTHWSMLTAGGICFTAFGWLGNRFRQAGLFVKSLLGCALITSVEFIFGVIFNIILKKGIWDYSKMPFHIIGQICPLYSGLWFLLSSAAVPFAGMMHRRLGKD